MKTFFKIFLITIFILFKSSFVTAEEKIKIGLLVPMTGENAPLGELLVKSTKLALDDIANNKIEIYPRDTGSNPNKTLQAAIELKKLGIKIIIGPIFFENLEYLTEINDIIFLSLTNKIEGLPKNVISSGVNSVSQLNAIKKFVKENELKKTIFLTPDLEYKSEIKKAIKKSEIKFYKHYIYNTEPTKLTKQIEKITNYKIRKQNLIDEITRKLITAGNVIFCSALPVKNITKVKRRYKTGAFLNVKNLITLLKLLSQNIKIARAEEIHIE